MVSEVFAAATFLEYLEAGHAEWPGDISVLDSLRAAIDDIRAESRLLPLISTSVCWLENVWPQVDFALCSGFRFNIVAHVSKDCYRDIAGGTC